MRFMDLCMPALVYLVIALLVAAFDFGKGKKGFIALIMNLLFIGLITYALNYLCIRYSVRTSWYVLAALWIGLPLLLVLLTLLAIRKH